jgi:hypothetical protein
VFKLSAEDRELVDVLRELELEVVVLLANQPQVQFKGLVDMLIELQARLGQDLGDAVHEKFNQIKSVVEVFQEDRVTDVCVSCNRLVFSKRVHQLSQ